MVGFYSSRLEKIDLYWKTKHPFAKGDGVETERGPDAVSRRKEEENGSWSLESHFLPFVLEIVSIDSTTNHSVEHY